MQFLAAARNRALEPLWQNASSLFQTAHGEVVPFPAYASSQVAGAEQHAAWQ